MTYIKAILGLLLTAVAVGAFAAAQASASGAPIVIQYEKTCNELTGHCEGTANGVSIVMQVDPASFRATGDAFKYSLTESVTVGAISFTAVMDAHQSPAGFIVLNGTVTAGSFAGARVHQRSNLVSVSPDETTTSWIGQLQVMPASA